MTKHQVHKYKRIKFKSGHIVFRCMLPGCSHFIREELLRGRLSVCWRCGEEHVITNTRLSKQHCDSCTKSVKENKYNDSVVDTLLNIVGQ